VHQFVGGVDPQCALIVKHMLEVQWARCRRLAHGLGLVALAEKQQQGGSPAGEGEGAAVAASGP
jgi:hypothetical protein